MTIAVGTHLGQYEIRSLLSAAGAGEVYRARDAGAGRDVAIRILPYSEALDRAAREAAASGHPNVLAVYDVLSHEGSAAVVSELLEGETLRARIDRGPIGPRQALAYVAQAARGLTAAGIPHGAISPDTLFVTVEGRVKLLDFGLAATADARTDVVACGAVLDEMLANNRRATPAMRRLVARCLAAEYASAADLLAAIEEISAGPVAAARPAAPASRKAEPAAPPRPVLAWVVAGLAAVAAVAAIALAVYLWPEPNRLVVRFAVASPAGAPIRPPGTNVEMALSPDGRRLAFLAGEGAERQMWVRSLDALAPQPLAGTEGAAMPFWSPDGRHIAFFADGRLKRVPASGGTAQTLADAPAGHGGVWSRDDRIVFAPAATGGLLQVPAAGGTATPLTELDRSRNETSHRWPFLLDGDRFGYLARGDVPYNEGIFVTAFGDDGRRLVLQTSSNAEYAPPGYLVTTLNGALVAVELEASASDPFNYSRQLGVSASIDPVLGKAAFTVSANGVIAYDGAAGSERRLVWVGRDGAELGTLPFAGRPLDVVLSPDETRAAIQWLDPVSRETDVWVIDLARGGLMRLTAERGFVGDDPVWSPDGGLIAFSSRRIAPDGEGRVLVARSDGMGDASTLVGSEQYEPPDRARPTDWSADGRFILYAAGGDLWRLPTFGDRVPIPLTQNRSDNQSARFSPDGQWVAYTSNESHRPEVYVQSVARPDVRQQVSKDGAHLPVWRGDGRELYFVSSDGHLMAVDVGAGEALEAGPPRPLFATRLEGYPAPNRYDVTADGQRFLMNLPAVAAAGGQITVVFNWQEALQGGSP